jgi:hypothetical protein
VLLSDAILDIEDRFIVHLEMGRPVLSYDQNDKAIDTGVTDWTKAPNGERYIMVTSGGWETATMRSIMFNDQGRAVYWWKWAVLDYAETVAAEDKWPKLHLYWRERPSFVSADYIALEQANLLASGNAAALPITIVLGTVTSRLLISRLAPDGRDELE